MKKLLRVFVNLIIAGAVIWVWMNAPWRGGMSARALNNLKTFTWSSNTFAALAALFWLGTRIAGKGCAAADTVKYIAAVAVGLTFLTVVCFLGPVFGFDGQFRGSLLWLHLLIPLAAMAECVFLNEKPLTPGDNRLAMLPSAVYGVYYVGNILKNGLRRNDWYGFFTWGWPVGVLILLVLTGVTFLIGIALRRGNEAVLRTER